ncbi:MAG TPA: hypothetical protein VF848_07200 [Steroidobacteraceae bacterium]
MHLTMRSKALIGTAVVVAAYVIYSSSGTDTVAPVDRASTTTVTTSRSTAPAVHAPAPRASFNFAGRVADAAASAALFAAHSWYTPPPPPPPPPPPQIVAPAAPTAPPLPFSFLGSYAPAGATAVYFLTRNDQIYDVKAGDVIDSNYTFEGPRAGQLVFTYKPLNVQQTLAAEGVQ